MRLKTKILEALASGPKFYKELLKLAKNGKQLDACLGRMTRDGAAVLRIKDSQNEYSLRGSKPAAAGALARPSTSADARFSIDHRGAFTVTKNEVSIELSPAEFAEARAFVEKTSEIHSPAGA